LKLLDAEEPVRQEEKKLATWGTDIPQDLVLDQKLLQESLKKVSISYSTFVCSFIADPLFHVLKLGSLFQECQLRCRTAAASVDVFAFEDLTAAELKRLTEGAADGEGAAADEKGSAVADALSEERWHAVVRTGRCCLESDVFWNVVKLNRVSVKRGSSWPHPYNIA
jgi:hypothetical protein